MRREEMRRIAICISGEIRTWNNRDIIGTSPEQSILSFVEYLKSKGYIVDLFGSTWDYCREIDDSNFSVLLYNDSNKMKSWFENEFFEMTRDAYNERERVGKPNILKEHMFNSFGQMFNVLTAYQLAGPNYDVYIRLRFDSLLKQTIEDAIEDMYTEKVYNIPTINIASGTDVVALVDKDYWCAVCGGNRTIENILKDIYATLDDRARFHDRIYEGIGKVTYLNTVKKEDARTISESKNQWYKKLNDVEKHLITIENGRPI